jgi:hypothetical protein
MFLIAVHVLHGVTIECLSEFDRCDRRAFVEGPQLRRQPLSDAQILIDRGDVGAASSWMIATNKPGIDGDR